MSAVQVERFELNGWELTMTARQGKEGEAIWFAVLTGLRGAVAIWPNPRKKTFSGRQATLDFWEPVMRALPSPEALRDSWSLEEPSPLKISPALFSKGVGSEKDPPPPISKTEVPEPV